LLQMQPVSPTKWMGQRSFKPVCFLWRIRWYQICQSCPRRILLLGLPWNIQRKRIQEFKNAAGVATLYKAWNDE
jgi:hypothetical protein